jgi:hypothetical protein
MSISVDFWTSISATNYVVDRHIGVADRGCPTTLTAHRGSTYLWTLLPRPLGRETPNLYANE